jgi:hypothetical protein
MEYQHGVLLHIVFCSVFLPVLPPRHPSNNTMSYLVMDGCRFPSFPQTPPRPETHSAFRESPKEKRGMERRARKVGHNIQHHRDHRVGDNDCVLIIRAKRLGSGGDVH